MVCSLVIGYFLLAYFILPGLFPPFYFAEYKATKQRLKEVPNLRMLDDWQHHDLTLEDCGFTVSVGGSQPVLIDFYDDEDWSKRFHQLDGLVLRRPWEKQVVQGEVLYISQRELATIGVELNSLSDFLENIDKIVTLAKGLPTIKEKPRPSGEWCYVTFDL